VVAAWGKQLGALIARAIILTRLFHPQQFALWLCQMSVSIIA